MLPSYVPRGRRRRAQRSQTRNAPLLTAPTGWEHRLPFRNVRARSAYGPQGSTTRPVFPCLPALHHSTWNPVPAGHAVTQFIAALPSSKPPGPQRALRLRIGQPERALVAPRFFYSSRPDPLRLAEVTSSPSLASTTTVSPGRKSPARILRAKGFSSRCCMTRLRGRAP